MPEKFSEFKLSDYIRSEEDARGLLRAAADEDDGSGAVLWASLGHIVEMESFSAPARRAGLNPGDLRRALSGDGNPGLEPLLAVARALGLRLRLEPVDGP